MFLVGLVHVPVVSGISYYNWVYNPSFESNENMVEDAGFESGLEEQGLVYGNWSASGTATYSTGNPHTGLKYIYCSGSGSMLYNFTSDYYTTGADIEEFGFWAYSVNSGYDFDVVVYYNDDTNDGETYTNYDDENWIYLDVFDDFASFINPAKVIVAFKLIVEYGMGGGLDDVYFVAGNYGSSDAQDEVDMNSRPWIFLAMYDSSFGDGLVTDEYHGGSQSLLMTESYGLPVAQSLDYLDSDSIYFCDLWIYVADTAGVDVTFELLYSDNTESEREITVGYTGSWVNVNFGVSWILENKIVTSCRIHVDYSTSSAGVYIDDVGIWSEVPRGFSRFGFTVVPAPMYGYRAGNLIDLYAGVAYHFYGTVYDDDGSASVANGTVTYTDSWSTYETDLVLGDFDFAIAPRPKNPDLSAYTETFGIVINDGSEVLSFEVVVYWYNVDYDSDDDDASGDTWFGDNDFIMLLMSMFVVFMPALLCSEGAGKDFRMQGFFGGMALGLGIMVITGYYPLFFLVLDVMIVTMFFISMLRRS